MAIDQDIQLPEFEGIRTNLKQERQVIFKVNNYTEEDDEYVRSEKDAGLVLDFIEDFQKITLRFFNEYPSLAKFFDRDFTPRVEFFHRENVLDLCFLDDCLFPEKEAFFFGRDGGLNPEIFPLHISTLEKWIQKRIEEHQKTQNLFLQERIDLDLKQKDLPCECQECISSYRNRLREEVFEQCKILIEEFKSTLEETKKSSYDLETSLFLTMKKSIDKLFYKVRFRLKRSSLGRLESQVKAILRDFFAYPSDAAKERSVKIREICIDVLQKEGLSLDLVQDAEFERFFHLLSLNVWKSKEFIKKEFFKILRSLIILKKKDVSSSILQSYLGEFWAHTQVRSLKRKIIYHMGPTNSGKTYHALEALSQVKKGCYLAPLRLLASEQFDTLNKKGIKTSLLTGEEVVEIPGAQHYSSTIEMARLGENFDCCVIDEIQMITDPQRGWAWTRALVNIFADEVHICGDSSVLNLIEKIVELCDDVLEIKTYERMTELVTEKYPIQIQDLKKSDAFIVFSRRNALRAKRDLEKFGFKVSIVYGRLGPEVRREQARKFDEGITDIIVSTDAISMGMNLPIKRIVFSTLSKFINSKEFPISQSEIKQIAGRAGRFKRFPTGFVTCLENVQDGMRTIKEALSTTLDQKNQCMVGPDLEIYARVNKSLEDHGLPRLKLSEFLRLFNTMTFKKPFFCVDLKEMIELAEMVEEADRLDSLTIPELFGFACAPVNLGLIEHVQYYLWIMNHYIGNRPILNEPVDYKSNDIDYLETAIKCVELYQWLARHFNNKNFDFDQEDLLYNKNLAVEKLNDLLSKKNILSDEVSWNKRRNSRGKSPYKSKESSAKKSPYNKKRSKNRQKKRKFHS